MLFPFPQSPAERRVVITGAGMISALGLDWQTNAAAFRLGTTAFRPVDLFDVSRQRVKVAAQVDLSHAPRVTGLRRRHTARLDRAAQLLLLAAVQAWSQSRWTAGARLPVVLATTSGGMSLGEEYLRRTLQTPRQVAGQAGRVLHYQAQRQGLDLTDALGFSGPVTILANACASGANALGHAFHLIRSGQAEQVLVGGYDALSQLVFSGFDALQALTAGICRPFDRRRDGLALGEGAAVFTFETLKSAQARRAEVLAEIVGYGVSTDVHHLTQPDPQGKAAFEAMSAACRSAKLEAAQVGYVNAHGTGTILNDSAETAALNRWAGSHAPGLAVSSTKSSIGHLLGAAGAVEAGVCLMALQGQWLPPTSTTDQPDPALQFRLISKPTTENFDYAMSNSFGFGGANASLVLRRWS